MTDDITEPADDSLNNAGAPADSTAVSRRRALGGAMLAGLGGAALGAVGGGFAGHAMAAAQRGDDDDTVDLADLWPWCHHRRGESRCRQRRQDRNAR